MYVDIMDNTDIAVSLNLSGCNAQAPTYPDAKVMGLGAT